jgi:hypothetical protein
MKFFHLTSNHNGQFSVTIFVPLPYTNSPPEIKAAVSGWVAAHNPN